MRVPMSWLRDHVDLPEAVSARDVADRLTAAGLQVERVDALGSDIDNVVVARVLDIEEITGQKKPIRWVRVSDGTQDRQVICGATNFAVDDVVAYARPPAMLPGGFRIEARKTYGHVSDGMLCSGHELGMSDDHSGILVLAPELPLGVDVVTALELREDVLDISVNPDRGYALSVRGVAREVATAYGLGFRDPGQRPAPEPAEGGQPAYPVRVAAVDGCDRYVARRITSVDPTVVSPPWLQRRLTLAGMRPLSLVVDVTNYVMLDVGQPLHAFDASRLRGPIVVRRAADGERLRTLDGVDRPLDPRDLVITDDSGPIALAGVMGGAATEIQSTTTEVVLESAHFDAVSVAYTARRHRLGSEASRRYERGVDPALAPAAAQLAVELLDRLGGGTPTDAVTDVDTRVPVASITLDPGLPGRIAGVEYPPAAVQQRLLDVGCRVAPQPDGALSVDPPSWRPDLRQPVDLVEEVVRLQGYDGLPATVPRPPAGHGLTRRQRLRRQVGRALADANFVEVLSAPFVDAASADRLGLQPDDPRVPSVRLANPVSDEEPFLRATLLPGLFSAVVRNIGRGLSDVAVFETGPVFRGRPSRPAVARPAVGQRPNAEQLAALDAALPDQPVHVAAVVTGARVRAGWWGPGRPADWLDTVEGARVVARTLGVELGVSATRHAPFHPGRCAELSVAGEVVGHAGELHPRVTDAAGLPPRTCALELSLDRLMDVAPDIATAPVVSPYPPAAVDVALVVPADVPVGDVESALREGAGDLLEAIRLFDVYTGEQIAAGRRSLAFSLRLRAPDRTLTTDEVAVVRDAAVAVAAARVGAELRSG